MQLQLQLDQVLCYIFDAYVKWLRYYIVCLATGCAYFKKNDAIDDTVNASLQWPRYSLAYTSSGSYLFMYTAVIMRCHLLAIAWSNNSLMRFALIDMFVSHFSENYDHLFTQVLGWHWPEDF